MRSPFSQSQLFCLEESAIKLKKFLAVPMLLLLLGVQAPAWANPDPSWRWNFDHVEVPPFGIEYDIVGVPGSPAVGDDGTIYVGSINGYFFAVNPDGTQKWVHYDEGGMFIDTPAIGDNGVIYVHNGNTLLGFSQDDGEILFSYGPICLFIKDPAIGQDGSVYIGSDLGLLYALTRSKYQMHPSRSDRAPALICSGRCRQPYT